MVTEFIEAVRECLKDGGFARNNSGEDSGGTFLVGYKGELFTIYDDYQVARSMLGFNAVGCGEDIAKGSMFSTKNISDPEERILQALAASEQFSTGVRGPFTVVSSK
jgi:hypothetical protein